MGLLEVFDHIGGLEDHFPYFGEHTDGLHRRLRRSKRGRNGRGEVEGERVVAPVERRDSGRRRLVVDASVEVVGPPGRVTQRPVADHLQSALDVRQPRMSLEQAVRLPQTVPRPVVVAKPLHGLLPSTRRMPVRLISHRRSVAERGECFQRHLFVCLSIR